MRFDMPTPCEACPFRRDRPGFLARSRSQEIAQSIDRGESFPCHKTLDYDEDDGARTPETQQCAGAEIFLANRGKAATQLRQIAGRLGMPVAELDMSADVFDSTEAMDDHHAGK